MSASATVLLEGRGRLLPATSDGPARVTFNEADARIEAATDARVFAYRDLSTLAVQHQTLLLVLGAGPGSERFLLSQFGQGQGRLVRELRDRRLRQLLADALVEVSDDPIDLVEYEAGREHGVAQLAFHPWGAVLAPVDERVAWIRIRRSAILSVEMHAEPGRVLIDLADATAHATSIVLPGLGERAQVLGDRFLALRRGAQEDAGRLVARLMPDAEYGLRQDAARALVDGRPATPADLPSAWAAVEEAVLVEPNFAASYGTLTGRAGELAALRAIGSSPVKPGGDEAKSWFFVPLPGNLVALELVSEGAHATYCFRIQPRSAFTGSTTAAAVGAAIRDVSEALVDARFLREPMALPDDQLRQPANLRYRLALRVVPSLAAARARFVARLVHRDDASWSAALDDLIVWHGSERDDAAPWPGRAEQETMVSDAGLAATPADDAGISDSMTGGI